MVEELVRGGRRNALVGWPLVGVVAAGAAWSFLAGTLLWGLFALATAGVLALPALATRRPTAMVPWPLPALAAVAAAARAAGAYVGVAGYVAVATLALVAVVELDAFTGVELSRRFAVAFAVMTAMAVQALWTVAQFYSDVWLGTDFVPSLAELQWDFVAVTVAAVALAALFEAYVRVVRPVDSSDRPTARPGSP